MSEQELSRLPNDEQVLAPVGVGDRLRAEREARGLTLDDVAQTLKVARRVLEQVEANAWHALPGYTFARGVVRGYAKFVQLDPEPLLRELESAPLPKPPSLDLPASTRAALPVPGQAEGRDRLAALAGVVLVAGAVTAYFLVPDHWLRDEAPTPAAAPAVVLPPPPAPVVAPPPVTESTTPAAFPATAVVAPAVPTTMPGAPAPAQPGATLTLRFVETSWVEVKDRSGVTVLSENVAAGNERSVVGQPPLTLSLGNAEGVTASFRGQPVDLKPHTRQKVARLALE